MRLGRARLADSRSSLCHPSAYRMADLPGSAAESTCHENEQDDFDRVVLVVVRLSLSRLPRKSGTRQGVQARAFAVVISEDFVVQGCAPEHDRHEYEKYS